MLTGNSYERVYRNFQWHIPKHYNIGLDVCDKWAHGKESMALIHIGPDDKERRYSFHQLKTASNRLANALKANGIQPRDRVAILLPQCPEALICHIAIYKLGAVALPLLTLFGPLALEYRLSDCGAKCVITDHENLPKLLELKDNLPDLSLIIALDSPGMDGGTHGLTDHDADGNATPATQRYPVAISHCGGVNHWWKSCMHGAGKISGWLSTSNTVKPNATWLLDFVRA